MINKIILEGRLVNVPELKTTQSGKSVTSFRIATTRNYKNGDKYESDFFNLNAWDKTAELICGKLGKGSRAIFVGELSTRAWETKDGQKRTETEIRVAEVYFIEKPVEQPHNEPQTATPKAPAFNPTELEGFTDLADEDELPF